MFIILNRVDYAQSSYCIRAVGSVIRWQRIGHLQNCFYISLSTDKMGMLQRYAIW